MKPVGLLGYTFLLAFLDLTAHNVQQHSYHFELLTNRNIVLIYSVTIFEQKKTKDCARSGSFRNKLQHRCFQL